MIQTRGFLRRLVFGTSLENSDDTWRRTLGGDTTGQRRLRQVCDTFALGYSIALEVEHYQSLVSNLEALDSELKDYAYEGAGMAMTVLDCLDSGRQYQRLQDFIAKAAAKYPELAHVGAGMAIAMLHHDIDTALAKMDLMKRWYAADGFGFAHGLYCWKHTVENQASPNHLTGYTKRAFDRGLGRGIWFGSGADVFCAINTLKTFPLERQADLWRGIGFASTYVGGTTPTGLEALKVAADFLLPHLVIGSAAASRCRYAVGYVPEHTAVACSIICDMTVATVSELANTALADLPKIEQESTKVKEPLFEQWQQRLQSY